MNVISIQSHVAYGHVGNSAAVFALQRLGVEVWPVHTVQFSNHTGYPDWQGQAFGADHIAAVIDGLAARGALARCDALLTGYIGDPALGAVVADTARRLRAANPRALWVCDPVMGDHGKGLFVREGVPEFMAGTALPAADVVTPNLFELELLSKTRPQGLEGCRRSRRAACWPRGRRSSWSPAWRPRETRPARWRCWRSRPPGTKGAPGASPSRGCP
jgi:pyridoxine kinase